MSHIAARVREENEALFAPENEFAVSPDLLVWEPVLADSYLSPDERVWVRVYIDGSALYSDGRVMPRVPYAAREMAITGAWQTPLAA